MIDEIIEMKRNGEGVYEMDETTEFYQDLSNKILNELSSSEINYLKKHDIRIENILRDVIKGENCNLYV